MANICNNWVEVSGDETQVKALFALVGKEFDFEKIIPTDSKMSGEAREKWGCSSIAFDTVYHEQCENYHEWSFWTKWCPPIHIYKKLIEQFPDVFIYWRYEEPGCGLYGYLNEEKI